MSHPDLPTEGAPTLPITPGGQPTQARRIGPYRLLHVLGDGGFGVVWLAEQSEPVRRRVALKLLKPGMDTAQVLARFEAERQALALMDHPGLAKVFDAGTDDAGRPFFAMEYVKGVPINACCDDERLDLEDRVRLMIQVCEAVQHAHMKGVIHRDLKPSNILVELVNNKPAPKVIDFGVAKALTQQLSDSTIYTERGQIIGTPEYMSPEQARGSGIDIDTRADVYSLGAVLYELLTGSPPFDPKTLREGGYAGIQRYIEQTDPQKPSTRLTTSTETAPQAVSARPTPRHLKGDLDWIVMRCLEKDRARRYETAAALADDLERFLKHEPVQAGPPSAAYRVRKFVRRNRTGVAAGAAVCAALLVATVLSLGFGIAASRDRARAESAEASALDRAAESEAVTGFLVDMLASVRPGPGNRDVTVREALDDAASRMRDDFADRPLVEARLRDTLAQSYSSLGAIVPAETNFRRAVDLYRATLPPGDEHTLMARAGLVDAIGAAGRVEDAAQASIELERDAVEALGEDSAAVATIRARRAAIYIMTEQNQLAREQLEKAVPVLERTLGPDNRTTISALCNLADVHTASFEWEAAEPLYDRAIASATRALGEDHPTTLSARCNKALMLRMNNRFEEARAVFEDVVPRQRRVLGDDHPDTGTTLANLAVLYKRMGLYDLARPLYEEELEISIRTLGDSHPSTFVSKVNWCAFLAECGSPEEAIPYAKDTIRLMNDAMGPDFIGAGFANRALADAYINTQRDAEALDALADAYRILSATISPESPPAWETAAIAAGVCTRMGRADDAAAWLAKAGDVSPPTLGP